MTSDEAGLLKAIAEEPLAPAPRLAYADWLEERGSPMAGYVRAEWGVISLAPGDGRFGERIGRLEEAVLAAGEALGGWEHAPALERLREKMGRLRARDPGLKLFGACGHGYRVAPPPAEADLLGLERRLGFLMPSEYRAFVLRVCNGHMGPGYGLDPLAPDAAAEGLAEPCPLSDADAEAALKAMSSPGPQEYPDLPYSPPGTLHLAEHGCGGHSFLVLSGQQRGVVWAAGDFTGPDVDVADFKLRGFFSWYEGWLDDSLMSRLS